MVQAASSSPEGRAAHLVFESGDPYISVYAKPGENWKYCAKNDEGECKDAIGWLDQDSKVWVVGKKEKVETIDPFTNEKTTEEYYPIQFEYKRKYISQDGTVKELVHERGPVAYIDASYIEFKKYHKLYSKPGTPPPSSSPSPVPSDQGGGTCKLTSIGNLEKINDVKCAVEMNNILDTAQLLKDRIGFCANQRGDNPKGKYNIYDSVIIKKLRKYNVPRIKCENNQYMTQDQMINIDALARTLYGEMANCFKSGLQYPMAVARIALNRAQSEDHKEGKVFIDKSHVVDKPTLAKVLTSPKQFSVWHRIVKGRENPPLKMALCPPREAGQTLLDGHKPSKEELAIWNHAVQIATEAVLFPVSFERRTKQLSRNDYFYTSGLGSYGKMTRVRGLSIEGNPLSKTACIEVWRKR